MYKVFNVIIVVAFLAPIALAFANVFGG
ncbi:hypothetical protein [Pseudomonas phage Almagne]|nr:hypothetical protein [Pseudomonas phage Almagne]